MLFPTFEFAVFFAAAFAGAWLLWRRPVLRKAFLVAASYVFYSAWDWRFCLLMLASSLGNFAAGLAIARTEAPRLRRLWVGLAVAANLAVLGFFKYYDFFIGSLNDTLYAMGIERELPFLDIILPIGISFFTFHGISYVVDVYRRVIPASRSPLDLMLYISFFPQLVAGPIVRASFFLPQIKARPDPGNILATYGFMLIVMGLFKKVVVANTLATLMVDPAFFDPTVYGPVDLLLAVWGYALQIYCDFSAYSDIATGCAALLGYRFPRNFDQPYRSQSLREFWRRWHISLSSWLRDYLYIPIGGNRGGVRRTRLNLMTTMVLGGLWHGAAFTFLIWGFLHGLGLVAERAFGWTERPAGRSWLGRAAATLLVFHFVCLAWIFFRAEDIGMAWQYLASFGNVATPVSFATPYLLAMLALGFAMQFLRPGSFGAVERRLARLPMIVQGSLTALAILAIVAFGPAGVAPFIYFQF